jgi:uncharacterized membrane protein YgdD (TMEM256/DUF423 family)
MTWDRRAWIVLASLSGFVAVIMGASAAHGVADPRTADLLKTGAQYQAIHALAMLACAALVTEGLAAALFLAGTLLFSGSLYALAAGAPGWTGMITPLGGLLFLGGWLSLAWAGWRKNAPSA